MPAAKPGRVTTVQPDNDELFTDEEVLQGDYEAASVVVPVKLVNPVRVDQMPTDLGALKAIRLAAAALDVQPVRVLNEDPLRASVTIWVNGGDVYLGSTQAGATLEAGGAIINPNLGPVRLHFRSELWASSVAAASTLSVAVEQWTR
jgi:hypothetical protein